MGMLSRRSFLKNTAMGTVLGVSLLPKKNAFADDDFYESTTEDTSIREIETIEQINYELCSQLYELNNKSIITYDDVLNIQQNIGEVDYEEINDKEAMLTIKPFNPVLTKTITTYDTTTSTEIQNETLDQPIESRQTIGLVLETGTHYGQDQYGFTGQVLTRLIAFYDLLPFLDGGPAIKITRGTVEPLAVYDGAQMISSTWGFNFFGVYYTSVPPVPGQVASTDSSYISSTTYSNFFRDDGMPFYPHLYTYFKTQDLSGFVTATIKFEGYHTMLRGSQYNDWGYSLNIKE